MTRRSAGDPSFREHCRHVCFVSGAGRNSKNGILSRKCPQAASMVDVEQEVVGGTETEILRLERFVTFSVFGMYS